MTTKFIAATSSTFVLSLSLTPELTTGLSLLVAAVFVGLVNLYIARTARLVAMKEVAKVLAPVEAKIDNLVPVVEKINVHVNSEKDRAIAERAQLNLQVELQREMIDQMKNAAALLAQAKATADVSTVVAQAAIAGATTPSKS